jgi:hypothetical protein
MAFGKEIINTVTYGTFFELNLTSKGLNVLRSRLLKKISDLSGRKRQGDAETYVKTAYIIFTDNK